MPLSDATFFGFLSRSVPFCFPSKMMLGLYGLSIFLFNGKFHLLIPKLITNAPVFSRPLLNLTVVPLQLYVRRP